MKVNNMSRMYEFVISCRGKVKSMPSTLAKEHKDVILLGKEIKVPSVHWWIPCASDRERTALCAMDHCVRLVKTNRFLAKGT